MKALVFHFCSILQEYIQEMIELDPGGITASYECPECSELLIITRDNYIINMGFYKVGRWEWDLGYGHQWKHRESGESVRWVTKS